MSSGFADHFSGHAGAYAQFRPRYPDTLAHYLAGLAQDHDLAWECGCGNGQLSGLLAGHFTQVIATDASEAQIARARAHPGVQFQASPAEESGQPDESVDLIVAAQAAHWFDLPAFYAEVRRVARPGAVLALVSYGLHEINPVIDALVRAFYHEPLDAYWPPERAHVESGYASLPFPFLDHPTPDLVMQAQWDYAQFLGYLETWSAFQRWQAEAGDAAQARYGELRSAIGAVWGDEQHKRAVYWPLKMRLTIIDK